MKTFFVRAEYGRAREAADILRASSAENDDHRHIEMEWIYAI